MDKDIHHLSDAKTMTKIVEGIVTIMSFNFNLKKKTKLKEFNFRQFFFKIETDAKKYTTENNSLLIKKSTIFAKSQ